MSNKNDRWDGVPHIPQGLYDDEIWVSLPVLRSTMEHIADQETLGAHPHTMRFVRDVMAKLRRMESEMMEANLFEEEQQ